MYVCMYAPQHQAACIRSLLQTLEKESGFFYDAQFVCMLLPVNHVALRRAALRAGVNLVLAENHPEAILAEFIV